MRKPLPVSTKPAAPPSQSDEPDDGRALQRARQFALQRGLPDPGPALKAPKPAPAGKRPARKKP